MKWWKLKKWIEDAERSGLISGESDVVVLASGSVSRLFGVTTMSVAADLGGEVLRVGRSSILLVAQGGQIL